MQKEIRIGSFTSTFFSLILLFYISLTLINIPTIPVLGKYAFLVVMTLIFLLLIQKKLITTKEIRLFFPLFLFNFIYLFNLDLGGAYSKGVMIFVNQTAYLMLIYLVYSVTWTKVQVKLLSNIYFITLPILLVLTFALPGVLNTNVLGSYAYYIAFFPLLFLVGYTKLKKSRVFFISALTILIVFATDTRSILLSASFAFATFVGWKLISKTKFLFNLYFILIVALNYFIVAIYPKMYTWGNYYELNNLSLKITGKPLLTGRNTIWSQLIELISLKPWFGYGSSVVPEDFLSTSLSAHNLYIQIALQTGLIGVFLLALFLFFIWKSFYKNRHDPKVILVSCFFVGILIHQSFEVTLTQNQFALGLLQWMIIGFGLNYALNSTYTKRELQQ